MIEAVLRVHLPCSWVTRLMTEHGATVNVVEQKDLEGGVLQSLVEIELGEADPAEVIASLEGSPDVLRVEAEVPPKGRILATVQVKDCQACHSLAESECFLTDATAMGDGGLVWHIIAPERSTVEDLMKSLDGGPRVELLSIRSAKTKGMLTDRQEKVISLAYSLGYFEFPKKINLTSMAKKLGVAKSTLSEILRTGEAKVLHAYFHGLMKQPR
ncbi:MAG: helix-turn-helix domain-containing protein [Thermoplasmata archaeon]